MVTLVVQNFCLLYALYESLKRISVDMTTHQPRLIISQFNNEEPRSIPFFSSSFLFRISKNKTKKYIKTICTHNKRT